jgi:phage/plasmid-associated DNA primase
MARGILAWMINGCLEWQRIGLAPPPAVQAATAEYLDAEDTVQLWIDECCEVGRQHWTVFSDLYESWSKWAEVNGEYVLPARVRSPQICRLCSTYNERFDGFIVRKFNGDKIKIAAGEIRPL